MASFIRFSLGTILLTSTLILPCPLHGQAESADAARAPAPTHIIAGLVLDAHTGEPLPGMDVTVRNVHREIAGRTISDDDGRFWISVGDAGLYRLAVSGFGYDSTATAEVAVARDQDLYLEVRIEPRPIGLGEIRVSAPHTVPWLLASGFYDRQRRGFGHFIGPKDLERVPGSFPSQVLRRVPGIRVLMGGRIVIRGGEGFMGGGCHPRVLLDGMAMRVGPNESIDDLVPLRWIDGIEIYKSAPTIPARWRAHNTCGVIAIWTKH